MTFPLFPLPIPTLLREIADPPKQLTIRGAYPDESFKFLAVVGSRTYSPYGRQVCEKLIAGLRGYPVVIVSGLALGIDGIAHQSALDAGLLTIAVPGSGLDDAVLYPASHRTLAQKILESGGALVSEFDPLWKPRPESFPQRNRIMAGMCHAVLVVEAEERSGTLITSRLAREYNRDVLAVPGPIYSDTSKGPHMLIKKGAALISGSKDILEALGIEEKVEGQPRLRFDLSDDEQAMVALLRTPLPRDELVRSCGRTVTEANILLSSLELKGVIEERIGKVYVV
ncbi:MAG: DNA-processing protein DprA [Candidatus Pacebacteria bacterium]|nr:DNA-processing protein DprA [Candidatus Paceibacterota bacterium]